MKKLTDRQRQVLNFLKTFIAENGYPPTLREIADAFLFSSEAASQYLIVLEKKGYVKREFDKPRTLQIITYESMTVAEQDMPEIHIKKGDHLHIDKNGNIVRITRMFENAEVSKKKDGNDG